VVKTTKHRLSRRRCKVGIKEKREISGKNSTINMATSERDADRYVKCRSIL
jgi:hypothetical protein